MFVFVLFFLTFCALYCYIERAKYSPPVPSVSTVWLSMSQENNARRRKPVKAVEEETVETKSVHQSIG